MDFERAFDTLGLAPGASEQDIESAYRRLCDDFDARIGRVTSLALRDRYAAARAELEGARAIALQAAKLQPRAASRAGDASGARAWAVLGLAAGASPLEVASAYVSLCEELDRELAAAPTEALRHRCLEARAEIDSAYQHCAAAPLAAETSGSGATRRPATRRRSRARRSRRRSRSRPLRTPRSCGSSPIPIRRARRAPPPPARRCAASRSSRRCCYSRAAGALGYVWWSDPERLHVLTRYLPLPPGPELVEAQTGAEYLRRRVAEERRDIQRRAEEAAERVARLQTEAPRRAAAIRARAPTARWSRRRRAPRSRSICSSSPSGTSSRAARSPRPTDTWSSPPSSRAPARPIARSTAYSEARANLEATLASLDEAESALGARYEAVDARDAWVALAASAGLEPGDAVLEGGQRLVAADGLLEAGNFAAAIPELRQASQNFRTAIDDGRRELAARRAAFEAERKTEQAQRVARAASERGARDGDTLPPVSASDRADVKLVTIPAGSFLYGCNGEAGRECPSSEVAGQRAELRRVPDRPHRGARERVPPLRGRRRVRAARRRERLQLERARPRRSSGQLHRLGSGRDLLRAGSASGFRPSRSGRRPRAAPTAAPIRGATKGRRATWR